MLDSVNAIAFGMEAAKGVFALADSRRDVPFTSTWVDSTPLKNEQAHAPCS